MQSVTVEKVFMEADAHSGGGFSAYMARSQYESQRKRPGTEYAFENHTPRGLHTPTGSHLLACSAINASDDEVVNMVRIQPSLDSTSCWGLSLYHMVLLVSIPKRKRSLFFGEVIWAELLECMFLNPPPSCSPP